MMRPAERPSPRPADSITFAVAWPRRFLSRYNFFVLPVTGSIQLRVLFFGRLKEVARMAEDSCELAEGATIESVFGFYTQRHPELAKFRASLVASRNQEFVPWETRVCSGDEVAFLPPVSGG
jgi:molybdopterin converting factor subunit 1